MELPVTKATMINLEHFPTYFPPETTLNRGEHVSTYMRNLITERMPRKPRPLHLPSLSQLASFFKCSHLEIYDAFRSLRSYGFDFTLVGIDTPIEVWRHKH